jgi:hypothetical protein
MGVCQSKEDPALQARVAELERTAQELQGKVDESFIDGRQAGMKELIEGDAEVANDLLLLPLPKRWLLAGQ